jgi:hypothetical protein
MLLQIVLDEAPVPGAPKVGYFPVLVESKKTTKGVSLSGRKSAPDAERVLGDESIEQALKDDRAGSTGIGTTTDRLSPSRDGSVGAGVTIRVEDVRLWVIMADPLDPDIDWRWP